MSTFLERKKQWQLAKKKGFSSRWTWLQSGHIEQGFSSPNETGTVADVIDDIDGPSGWQAVTDGDGFVQGQSGEIPKEEPVPSGVTRTDSSTVQRAKVNHGPTSGPMIISGDNRNVDPSKVRTIDISELRDGSPERKLVLELAAKNPNYIKLV